MCHEYHHLRRAAVAIFIVLIMLAPLGSAIGSPAEEDTNDEVPMQQPGAPRLVRTPYYVRTQSGTSVNYGELSPAAMNESATIAEITVPGVTFPRFLVSRVGYYEMTVQNYLEVHSVDYGVVWARGDEPVTNARFTMYLLKNGNRQHRYDTNTVPSMDTTPIAFEATGIGPLNNPLTFRPGEILGLEILYGSSSRRGVGPNPGCVVLANSWSYATRWELRVKPLEMNITAPVIEGDKALVSTRIIDSAGLSVREDEILVNLNIVTSSGTTAEIQPEHIEIGQITQSTEDHAWVTNWTWYYKRSNAMSGLFEFTVDCSYGVKGINYTNTTFYEINFPEDKGGKGILETLGPMGIGGIAAAIILIAVVGLVVSRRRSKEMYVTGYGYPKAERPPREKRAPRTSMFRRKPKEAPPPRPGKPRPSPRAPPPDARRPPTRAPPGAPARAPPGAPAMAARPPPKGKPPKGKYPKGMPPNRRPPPKGKPPKRKHPKGMPPPRRRPREGDTRPWKG